MVIDVAALRSIWPTARFIGLRDSESFEVFSVLGEPSTDARKCVLYFGTSSTEDATDGWYSSQFNRSINVTRLARMQPSWAFVVSGRKYHNSAARLIIVDSVQLALEQLIQWARVSHKLTIIGVTGSVGKTTTVRLLKRTLGTFCDCDVIPSKRLTPLLVFDYFLNRFHDNLTHVIAEIGLFDRDHVAALSRLLQPRVGVLLNVRNMHTNPNSLPYKSSILQSKLRLLQSTTVSVINRELIGALSGLGRRIILFSSAKSIDCNVWVDDVFGEAVVVGSSISKYSVQLPLLTVTSLEQIAAIVATCESLGFSGVALQDSLFLLGSHTEDFCLSKSIVDGRTVFLDQHASYRGYFEAISEHLYSKSALIIESLNFVNESPLANIPSIIEMFDRFSLVRIRRELRRQFGQYLPSNAEVVKEGHLLLGIPNEYAIFYHDPLHARST